MLNVIIEEIVWDMENKGKANLKISTKKNMKTLDSEKRQSLILKIRIAIKTGNNILLRELNDNFYRLNAVESTKQY